MRLLMAPLRNVGVALEMLPSKILFRFRKRFPQEHILPFRIGLQSLMLVMKFVYNFATMNDVEKLYDKIQDANLPVPMKELDQFKSSLQLPQPLAISDYLKGMNPGEKILDIFQNENWEEGRVIKRSSDFSPRMTDAGLCSTYNAHLEKDVFDDKVVKDFHEVFHGGVDKNPLKSAQMKEYSFIIDTQTRRSYPFESKDEDTFAT